MAHNLHMDSSIVPQLPSSMVLNTNPNMEGNQQPKPTLTNLTIQPLNQATKANPTVDRPLLRAITHNSSNLTVIHSKVLLHRTLSSQLHNRLQQLLQISLQRLLSLLLHISLSMDPLHRLRWLKAATRPQQGLPSLNTLLHTPPNRNIRNRAALLDQWLQHSLNQVCGSDGFVLFFIKIILCFTGILFT